MGAYAVATLGGGAHLFSLTLGAYGGSEPINMTQGQFDIWFSAIVLLAHVSEVLIYQPDHRKDEQLGRLHVDCLCLVLEPKIMEFIVRW